MMRIALYNLWINLEYSRISEIHHKLSTRASPY